MTSHGKVYRISVSTDKGDRKHNIDQAEVIEDYGIKGDAHAGTDRQVSLLPFESFDKVRNDLLDIKPGDFAENITTVSFDFTGARIGDRLRIGDSVHLVITHIGKECHQGCHIKEISGDCIMPREGVFARVEQGGAITVGDPVSWE